MFRDPCKDIPSIASLAKTTLLDWEGRTSGNCYNASFALGLILARLGLDVRMVQGQYNDHPHFWLETLDGWYLDITADQFGGPSIIWDHRDSLPQFKREKHLSYNFQLIAAINESLQCFGQATHTSTPVTY